MIEIEDSIASIYRSIDHRNWDDLEKLLSPDVIYSRPGYPDFTSRSDFIHFYKNARPIDRGAHSLQAIITRESLGCCWGAFNGLSSDGGKIDILFSDWYLFENGLVSTRRTFIFAP